MHRLTFFACVLAFLCGCENSAAPETAPIAAEPPAEAAPATPAQVGPVSQALFDAVERSPDDPAARRALAIALHDARRRHEAIEHFEVLVQLAPTRRHLLDLALGYHSVSRLTEAVATYERILDATPSDAVALHNLGNIALRRGDAPGAAVFYRRAITAKPDYLLAHYHLGNALIAAEQLREAFGAYENALTIEPTTPADLAAQDDSLYQLAALDLKMGAHQRAAKWLEELIAVNPEHSEAHYAYAQALIRMGREDEAERELEIHAELMSRRQPTGQVATGD